MQTRTYPTRSGALRAARAASVNPEAVVAVEGGFTFPQPFPGRGQQNALAAFMIRKAAIDAHLAQLQALSADHFGVDPDAVHWGHVGDLVRIVGLLEQATENVRYSARPEGGAA